MCGSSHAAARAKRRVGAAPAVAGILACLLAASTAVGRPHGAADRSSTVAPDRRADGAATAIRVAHVETLWIFDADFEDLTGDNAGWVSYDRSGFIGQENYWHKDTIRINGFAWLGDSTWWCGTVSPCWRQPRGYGNDWIQYLERDFPLASWSNPGDLVEFEWDQRYAMERLYDYGYVDISTDGGLSWTTIARYNNTGFQGAGLGANWNHPVNGHIEKDLSAYAGTDIRLRYRFESDVAYSSEDQHDNAQHSVKDGAWQLDNITLRVNSAVRFYDDAESGNLGWIHEDLPPVGQTGVAFRRGRYGIDFETGRPFTCDAPPVGAWMYGAVDPIDGTMVDQEHTWLTSPPISIAGAMNLVGAWDMWVDLPRTSNDVYDLYLCSKDIEECVASYLPGYWDEQVGGWWDGGPYWVSWSHDWTAWVGNDWLAIMWKLRNEQPPDPGAEHRAGIFLDRQRVGVLQGDFGTRWELYPSRQFGDWFEDDLALAFEDSSWVRVTDEDGVYSVYVLASGDGGGVWEAYEARRESPGSNWWIAPPPANQLLAGVEIRYFWEATDGAGNTSTYPDNAPEETFELSILPIVGSVENPAVLLVDKHGGATAGEERDYRHPSERYYREALDVLGYVYDVYDFDYAREDLGKYPDTSDMRYYDTQIWFANREFDDPDEDEQVVHPLEQAALVAWLSQAEGGRDRNLLLTGNEINSGLAGTRAEGRGFLSDWLATEFLADDVGDTLPSLRDASGGFGFMRYDDRRCILAGGCPALSNFDEIEPTWVAGSELVAEYVTADRSVRPAGVAYTSPTMGYQTVNLGFGMEFMMDYLLPCGQYASGAADRVDLLANIMEYFGREPDGPGTGTGEGHVLTTALSRPTPNPSARGAVIAYGLARRGRVTMRIYSAAGRLVRTLVDGDLDAGGYSAVWDGATDAGSRAASGVYFVRMEAEGLSASEKLVLLK
jgi:hypothetical protein